MGYIPWWYLPICRARLLGTQPWVIDDTSCSRYLWGIYAELARNSEVAAASA